MYSKKPIDTQNLVLLALFTAIIIALQALGLLVRFGPFSVSLVFVPIAIGASLLGSLAGAWLGLVFGLVVLISGEAGEFMAINPAASIIVVLLKGALAGFASGLMYKSLEKLNKTIAAVTAAVVCPIVNTGIFIIGMYAFFIPTLTEWGYAAGATSVTAFIFIALVGVNFLLELGINLVFSPAIVRIIQYKSKSIAKL